MPDYRDLLVKLERLERDPGATPGERQAARAAIQRARARLAAQDAGSGRWEHRENATAADRASSFAPYRPAGRAAGRVSRPGMQRSYEEQIAPGVFQRVTIDLETGRVLARIVL